MAENIKKVIDVVEKPRIENIIRPFQKFFNIEASSGIILLASAILSMIWANSQFGDLYENLWSRNFTIGISDYIFKEHLLFWINDGLMAIFFFVVGLEIKREILVGELATVKKALLPLFAAIGGMLFPALIYVFFNHNQESAVGWGIPMATDIAFSIGIISILGNRIPYSLKVFLIAFAIIDDLGAILVIAIFYTSGLNLAFVVMAFILVLVLILCNKLHIRNPVVYVILGVIMWFAFLKSGIHSTVSGVILALTIPTKSRINSGKFIADNKLILSNIEKLNVDTSKVPVSSKFNYYVYQMESSCEKILPPAHRLEHNLHPLVAFFIMPLFALANSGFRFQMDFAGLFGSPVIIGIILGLFLGKALGVYLFARLSVKFKISSLPQNVAWKHILGVAVLGGVGFTMSLFISTLAFDGTPYLDQAKIGILAGSLVSGITGYMILKSNTKYADSKK